MVTYESLIYRFSQTWVIQSPIKLTQGNQEFWFKFCNFAVRFSIYVVLPSVLSLNNLKVLKIHKTRAVKNIFIKKKLYFSQLL